MTLMVVAIWGFVKCSPREVRESSGEYPILQPEPKRHSQVRTTAYLEVVGPNQMPVEAIR
jgi:hypothetical protein